jgi:hypothetical protein
MPGRVKISVGLHGVIQIFVLSSLPRGVSKCAHRGHGRRPARDINECPFGPSEIVNDGVDVSWSPVEMCRHSCAMEYLMFTRM